jgi:class 3 adenylate cyclase
MKWFDNIILWMIPEMIFTDAALLDKWRQEDRIRIMKYSRALFLINAILSPGHFFAVDASLGLAHTPLIIGYRWGSCIYAILALIFSTTQAYRSLRYYRLPMIFQSFFLPVGFSLAMQFYPKLPVSLPLIMSCCFAALLYTGPLLTALFLFPLLLVQQLILVKFGFDAIALSSISITGSFLVILVRGSLSEPANISLMEAAESLKREANARGFELAEQLLTVCPREIKRRIMVEVTEKGLTPLQAVDEVMKLNRKVISCITSDIRGYTSASKDLSFVVKDVVGNIQMCSELVEEGGGIFALVGDGLFAIFDEPAPPSNHILAALIGFRIVQANQEWNTTATSDAQKVRRFVTMACGEAAVGNIGGLESARMFTALGTPANLVSRIDSLTKTEELARFLASKGPQLLLSSEARRLLGEAVPSLIFETFALDRPHLKIKDFPEEHTIYFLDVSQIHKLSLEEALLQHFRSRGVLTTLAEIQTTHHKSIRTTLATLGDSTRIRDISKSPFYPRNFRDAGQLRAKLLIPTFRGLPVILTARVWRLWPFGIDLILSPEDRLTDAQNVGIELTLNGQTHTLAGFITGLEQSTAVEGRLLAIRFYRAKSVDSLGSEKRKQDRWTCSEVFYPTGVAPHPLLDNEFVVFQVKDVSAGGMQIVTSMSNKNLVEGLALEAMMTFPQMGQFFTVLKIKRIRQVKERGTPALALNVEMVDPSPLTLEVVGRYTEQFSAEADLLDSEARLSQAGFTAMRAANTLRFKYVSTEQEFTQIMALRGESLGNDGSAIAPQRRLSDVFDSQARLLMVLAEQELVAGTRLRKVDTADGFEYARHIHQEDIIARRAESMEMSWTVCKMGCNASHLLRALFREVVHAALQSKRRLIVGSSPLAWQKTFEKMGCHFPEDKEFFVDGSPLPHRIFCCDLHLIMVGERLSPILWSFFFSKHRSLIKSLPAVKQRRLTQLRLSFILAIDPIVRDFARRRYLSMGSLLVPAYSIDRIVRRRSFLP